MSQAEHQDVLRQWVVYENPSDYPGMFVAREWIIGRGTLRASEVTPYVDPYLENVRRFIASIAPGAFCIARSEEDDPTIVETWT